MNESHVCPNCGSLLPSKNADCAGCLLLGGFDDPQTVVDSAKSVPGNLSLPTHVGPYEICKKIGEGGTAEVYLAKQSRPIEREVAFKLIKAGMDSERVVARFTAERQVLARLRHPYIATILDAGTTPEHRPYFVLEYVPGRPLTEHVEIKDLNLRERLEIFQKVCQAVEHAHQRGIIHRDLKPSNVLVDSEGDPKVIDFGIARVLSDDLDDQTLFLTREGDFLGTPAYMSPEQTRGQQSEVDTRADVYALGVILYELLTGHLPFSYEQIRSQKTTDAARPSTRSNKTCVRDTSLRGDLDWIVLKALESEKDRRYSGVAALAEDIKRHLANEPVSAGPPTATYRLKKFARRHRAFATSFVVALAAIIAGASVAVWQAYEANKARREAEENLTLAQEAEKETLRQTAITNAVNSFLIEDLLGSTDLENTTNPRVTLLELIDRAAENVDQRFADEPQIAAILHDTIADVYRTLGRYDEAFDHYEISKIMLIPLVGNESHPEAPKTVRQLIRDQSVCRFRQRKLAESRELLEEYLRLSREARVSENELVPARMQLASQLNLEGKLLESIKEQVALIEELSKLGDPKNKNLLQTKFNLGLSLYNVGQYQESIPLFEEFLSSLDPVETLNGASALTELAVSYQAVGRTAEAEKQLLRALGILEEILPPGHPQTLNTKARLASLWDVIDEKIPDAIKLYREIIATGLTDDNQAREQAVVALHNLALVLMTSNLPEAESLIRRAIEERTKLFGDDHPQTVSSRYNLGLILRYQGKHPEAEKTFLKVIEQQAANYGAGHPETLWTTRVLAHLLFDMKRPEEARKLCRKILAAPLPGNHGLAAMVTEQKNRTQKLLEQYPE